MYRTFRTFRLAGTMLSLLPLIAMPASAQAGECELEDAREASARTVAGEQVWDVRGPLLVVCDDGAELRADSAVIYTTRGVYELYRNVHLRDAERDVRANQGEYRDETHHVRMTGDVVYRDLVRHTVLRGPELEYFREMPGREEARVVATGRPRLVAHADGEATADSTIIDADRITSVGESLLNASGSVVIQRPDLTSRSRTARYETAQGRLDLSGDAVLEGEEFRLEANDVTAELPGEVLERVIAIGDARLVGEDLTVTGRTIDIYFQDELLQRLVALGVPEGTKATAVAELMELEADSIDAILPDQLLEEVVAVGRAFAVHQDDTQLGSTLPPIELEDGTTLPTSRDWIRGDTVRAHFAQQAASPGPTPDAVTDLDAVEISADDDAADEVGNDRSVQLSRLVASGSAGALFRAHDDDDDSPSISYVTGQRIEIEMEAGEMHLAQVLGLRRGIYLEALGQGEERIDAEPDLDLDPGLPQDEPEPDAAESPADPNDPNLQPDPLR